MTKAITEELEVASKLHSGIKGFLARQIAKIEILRVRGSSITFIHYVKLGREIVDWAA